MEMVIHFVVYSGDSSIIVSEIHKKIMTSINVTFL